MIQYTLNIGDKSGAVEIVDQDRLCYQVRSTSKGSQGLRTISKQLLDEFVQYVMEHPDASAADAREALSGKSEVDKYEYGYNSTLLILAKMVVDGAKSKGVSISQNTTSPLSLQQIYYGAPGTGKSHEIKRQTAGKAVVRTTFHPDTDYSTFVGAYKPTMEDVEVQTVPVVVAGGITLDTNRGTYRERRITYKFVKQAFLKAYLAAWRKYAERGEGEAEPQYLVIEEINRGNCAQIFGDLFQLLDRQDNGFSTYPIEADTDLQREIAESLAEPGGEYALPAEGLRLQGAVDDYCGDLEGDITGGKVLLLPPNLHIWATMNTSDQSLFPIDSAFKRRWDWQYVPISDAGKGWVVRAGGADYGWWDFLQAINKRIYDATYSEDKQLGYYFCRAQGGVVSAETFVGKVVFYLWNDVFKDSELEGDAFRDTDGTRLTFDKFYTVSGGRTQVVGSKVELFLKNLGLEPLVAAAPDEADEN